jgi:hypothetical protein
MLVKVRFFMYEKKISRKSAADFCPLVADFCVFLPYLQQIVAFL